MIPDEVDLLIIGGGINGAGIARDAAGRGLKVLLCEKGDFAGGTSSASSKLIHGGLRYLEHYEFRLVREALSEREVLLSIAPHIAWPLRFILPHNKLLRPAWMLRLGLLLYDYLAPRSRLPRSHGIDLRRDIAGRGLKPELKRGFDYSDCWVEDARLVVLNALDAAERGATILPRHACTGARQEGGRWLATIEDGAGSRHEVRAGIVVNAAGPWVGKVLSGVVGREGEERLRLIKGSHIVVPRLFEGPQAYILQNPDQRIVFAIPYEGEFTLIGTTDVPYDGDPAKVAIDGEETDYLCASVNRYFTRQIGPQDVVWTYSGVRPLYDDSAANPSAVTRDYVFDISGGTPGEAPLLSIFGGKITTYRRLAEHAMEKLAPFLPAAASRKGWTGTVPLPGGDLPGGDFDAFLAAFAARHPWLPAQLALRYAHAYGTRADRLIGDAASLSDLGVDFGGGLYEREVAYLTAHEWARTADDILWRRSKLGLHVPAEGQAALSAHVAARVAA